MATAWSRIQQAYRQSTSSAHRTHLRTFLSFLYFLKLPFTFTLSNVLAFLEYLYQNHISPKVIKNYLSSITTMAKFYQLDHQDIFHPSVARYIRSISINSRFQPTLRGLFDVKTLYSISVSCDQLSDPPLIRAIFLLSFYAFLRMSNVAPHSRSQFDPGRHFLRLDLIFGPPGAHLVIKWTKTLQDNKSHHVVQLPEIDNLYLCPVKALKALLSTRKLPPTAPLFATNTTLSIKSLIHRSDRPSKQSLQIGTSIMWAMASTHLGGRVPPYHMTTVFHCKTLCPMVYGEVRQYGLICKTPLMPPPLFIKISLCPFQKSLYKLTIVQYVLTCEIKLSNLSFTNWLTYWTLTLQISGSNLHL